MARLELNPREIENVKLLVEASSLTGVEYHKISGQRLEENKQTRKNEESIEISMEMRYRVNSGSFGVMLAATVLLYYGEINVNISAEYSTDDDYEIDPDTVKAFANYEGVAVLEPYVREVVQSLSTRLWQKPFIMPKLEPDFVGFDLDDKNE